MLITNWQLIHCAFIISDCLYKWDTNFTQLSSNNCLCHCRTTWYTHKRQQKKFTKNELRGTTACKLWRLSCERYYRERRTLPFHRRHTSWNVSPSNRLPVDLTIFEQLLLSQHSILVDGFISEEQFVSWWKR